MEQKITFTNAGRKSAPVPLNVGAEFVPAGVKLAVPFVGTLAGHATVPAGVPALTAEVVSDDPVNVSAGTVKLDPGEDPPIVLNAPELVPALLPLTVATLAVPFVPVGVTVCVCVPSALPANVGTLAGHEIVSAGTVPAAPVNVGAVIVPAGVCVFDPPVVPTSPLAAIVPSGIAPFSELTSA